jgi:hypothetical protein
MQVLTAQKYQAVIQLNLGNYRTSSTTLQTTYDPLLGHINYSLQCSGLFNSLEQITFPLPITNPFGFND